MPIKATNLSYEEFNDRLLSLLKLVEGIQTKIYADSADIPKITIGIGFNIEVDIWREVVLMYKVGILQYADLENGVYTLANILGKQSQSTQTLINTTSKEIKDKINEYRINNKIQKNTYQTGKSPNQNMIDLQKDINTILQNNIKNYNEYPENINQKLNANMVFELTDNEAIEVKNIISFNEIKALRNKLNTWNANYLTSFSKTESINPQEFIPLLSIYYQRPARFNPESGLILLQKALKDKNRFLAWFSVRYYADIRQFKNPYYSRRIQEAAMFGLNNKDSNNQIEYFSTSLDIFSCLNFNFKEANTKQGLGLPDTYTYLSFMQTYKECKEIDETAKNLLKEYNIYHTKDKHYYSYVGKDEFQDITNILSPYLDYLNTLTQKTFSLENIYCIQSFYGVLGAHKLDNVASINKILSQRFSNNSKQPQPTTQDSTAQANPAQSTNENPTQILILYPKATPLPIQIIQPENTFLTLVVGKNAKLDCSKLLLDKCEIHYLQYDENQEESTENPKITALKTDSELTLTTKDSNLYEVIHNGIIYYISKNEGVLRVALGQDREEVIELYNFAKENKYKILKESHSQILDIQLKLQDNKELPTSHNGNFALTINNLTLLDKNGKNLDIAEDYTLYLHNCENRIIYENTSIQKNTDDTYRVNFSFDLIQDEDSNFFKRTTKLIIATQNLSNDFSTSEIHTKGNVAVVSLSSADKKGGNYTFTKKVSAQEFGEEIKTIYIDNDNPKAYQEQIDDSKKKLNIINIKAYSDKEQTNEIDTCDSETTIFVRAILNEEDRVFYDETIHWAYYIKGASEDLNKIDRDKIKQMENIEGNDIIFSLDMLAEDDKEILLKSLQNNSQKYELILFAYFKKPAIKVGNNITSIVLSMKTSQSMSSPTSPFTLNIKDYLCLTSP
ncbi:hypothetical protein [Helicobacter cinaedi]|uniref:hypothetical protein n=1 Tax=Helicobacter cinaedi TaxID=213 RepID=UPI000DC6D432|nr:hypothetical protein [Helicobacter cinaedi]BBB20348.1 hypothetical protein HC081234_15250 [Helicobacter cinaedi]